MRYFTLTPYLPYSGDEDYWITLLKKISIEFLIEEFDTTLINYGSHSSFEIMSDEKTVSDICARYNMSYHASCDREMFGGTRTITRFPPPPAKFVNISFDDPPSQTWQSYCSLNSPDPDRSFSGSSDYQWYGWILGHDPYYHNLNGPAIVRQPWEGFGGGKPKTVGSVTEEYYLYNNKLTKEEFLDSDVRDRLFKAHDERLQLMLKHGVLITDEEHTKQMERHSMITFPFILTPKEDQLLHQKVTELAHQLWIQRGCPIGSPEVDWNEARRRLFPMERIGTGVINPRGLITDPLPEGTLQKYDSMPTRCEFCGKYDHDDGGCNV